MTAVRICLLVTLTVTLAVTLAVAPAAHAQLTDETQTSPHVAGSGIAKSLDEQIGAGHGDAFTYGSAVYLIARDPARSIRRGRQLFQRKFTAEQGLGPRIGLESTGNFMQTRALGAGLMDSCAGCHGRPRGSAGFGGDVVTRPDSRDAPHLFGLGLQEMLADEMTRELRAIRDEAILAAQNGESPVSRREESHCRRHPERCEDEGGPRRTLVAKGIHFGTLVAHPDGTVDLSGIEGVGEDLRVRPFFHHGETVSMREFAIGAFNAEMGMQAVDPILCAATDPDTPERHVSPAGFVFDPSLDVFERPPACDPSEDVDGDGVANEIDAALVDHMEFYLLNYFKPGLGKQTAGAQRGLAQMNRIGCTDCHVQNLVIEQDRRVADVTTVHDPRRGIFNRLFATAETRFEVVEDGDEYPRLVPSGERFVVENIFTDFKRHDLGEAFHERDYDGSMRTEFLTEALWGVGSTAPYGHDGRSINLEEVILRHGGEAGRSRDAFASLPGRERRNVLDFLATLILFPPDDTASNLDPGDPDGNPQLPENHGSINLGALFQIPDEGRE